MLQQKQPRKNPERSPSTLENLGSTRNFAAAQKCQNTVMKDEEENLGTLKRRDQDLHLSLRRLEGLERSQGILSWRWRKKKTLRKMTIGRILETFRSNLLSISRPKICLKVPLSTVVGENRLVRELHRMVTTIQEITRLSPRSMGWFLLLEGKDSSGNTCEKSWKRMRITMIQWWAVSIWCRSEHSWIPNSAMNVMASAIKMVHAATERDSTLLREQLEPRSLSSKLPIPKLRPEEAVLLDMEDPRQWKFSSGKMYPVKSVEMIHQPRKNDLEDRD